LSVVSRHAPTWLVAVAVSLAACSAPGPATAPPPPSPVADSEEVGTQEFARLEQRFDARLGVYAMDTATATHVDRIEPQLNETSPGDIRDTSVPRSMASTLRAFTLGDALPAEKRTVLLDMMRANTTGGELIRAGVPAGWQVADKTGAADYATRDDIAVIWPPRRAPIVLVIMSDRAAKNATYDNKLIAQAATVALKTFQ
jgi:beta-lactamase class A